MHASSQENLLPQVLAEFLLSSKYQLACLSIRNEHVTHEELSRGSNPLGCGQCSRRGGFFGQFHRFLLLGELEPPSHAVVMAGESGRR
jgi:hypothetical protein